MRASMRDVRGGLRSVSGLSVKRGRCHRILPSQFVVCTVTDSKNVDEIVYRRSGANLYVAKSHSAFGGRASDSLGISSASVITAGGGAGT